MMRGKEKKTPRIPRGPRRPVLTPRETEIAHLVAQGKTARQISATLPLTQQSVERRIQQIADKLPGDLPPRNRITRWWWQDQHKESSA